MRRALVVALSLAAWCAPAPRVAAQTVFAGDPIDPATGLAFSILPGVPLLYPGADGRFGTADDVVDANLIGDVDLVVRTAPGLSGAVIPAQAPGVAAAPAAVAGGPLGGGGSQAPFFLVFSDGGGPPAAGSALFGPELDYRRALVVAYADLDGDGWIGPTASSAPAEIEVRRQEALTFAGRTMAEFAGGVASGQLGLAVSLPASAGGLGVVVGGGAATGATPNLYDDGPWATTLLPYMIPLAQGAVVGGEATGPMDALGLVDLELSDGDVYLPAPNHPQLGTSFAIPLDGSSPTVDLVRSISGPVAGTGFARPVDGATYAAQWQRVIRPVVASSGARLLVEPLAAATVDGSVGSVDITVFPADLLGNAADPPPGGTAVAFEVGAAVRITAPDTDGDPARETIIFTSPRAATLTLAATGDGAADALLATCDGVACGALPLSVSGGGPPTVALDLVTARMRNVGQPGRGVVALSLAGAATQPVDPSAAVVRVAIVDAAGSVYERTFPAGSLAAAGGGRRFGLRSGSLTLSVRSSRGRVRVALRARGLDLPAGSIPIAATLQVGGITWQGSRDCVSPRAAVRRCGP